jgi:hypothetical protein
MPQRAHRVVGLDRARRRPLAAACPLRLAATPAPAQPNGSRWIQVAYEGAWDGHAIGPFEFSADDLQQMVDNFHRHPSFTAGAEAATLEQLQAGAYDVIPFDWRHASTGPIGASPMDAQVAQAWALELAVRKGDEGAELWALVRYLEPMGTFVREGKVHWTSLTADPHYIDPVTAEDCGWYVMAIAFTNDPFLQGMVPVAAERRAGAPASSGLAAFYRGFDPYCPPATPTEALSCLRELFELPATAELGAVLAEVGKLRVWATGGGAPAGVDVAGLVGAMRQLFNLPTLTAADQVFAAADGLLAALASEPPEARSLTRPSTTTEPTTMTLLAKIAAKLAGKLNLARGASEEDIADAILEYAEKSRVQLEAGASATTGLAAVLSALGVEDVAGATKKIAEMFKSVDQLEKAMPELKSLRDGQEATEEGDAEKDVGDAVAAYRMPETARPALLAMRTGGVQRDKVTGKLDLVARAAARAAFRAAYPPIGEQAAALTRPAFPNPAAGADAGRNGPSTPGTAPVQPARGINGIEPVDLSRYEGVNRFERAIAHVKATSPKAKELSRPELFKLARGVLASPGCITGD